jgi:WD40 repeat protein
MLKLQGHRGKVRALGFSPDGQRIAAVAGSEQRVSLWDLHRGERTLSPGDADEIQSVAFTPDGCSIVIASGRHLWRWDLDDGTITERWFRGANHCHQVACSPDGSVFAAACFHPQGHADRFRVDLFRPAEPDAKKKFLVGDYGTPYCLAFSPDGRFLAAGGEPKRVRVWSMKEKAKAVSRNCVDPVFAVAFTHDGALLAVAAGSMVQFLGAPSCSPLGGVNGHKGNVRAVNFAPDGTLLSGGDDGTVRLWDVATESQRVAYDWKIGRIGVAAFSPDGTLAAAGGDKGLVVWDVD